MSTCALARIMDLKYLRHFIHNKLIRLDAYILYIDKHALCALHGSISL